MYVWYNEAEAETHSVIKGSEKRLKHRGIKRTVFEDESHGGDGLAADEHDGIISRGLGEHLGLAVRVQDQAAALVQELLVVQRDAGPAGQQLLEQRRPVGHMRNSSYQTLNPNKLINIFRIDKNNYN